MSQSLPYGKSAPPLQPHAGPIIDEPKFAIWHHENLTKKRNQNWKHVGYSSKPLRVGFWDLMISGTHIAGMRIRVEEPQLKDLVAMHVIEESPRCEWQRLPKKNVWIEGWKHLKLRTLGIVSLLHLQVSKVGPSQEEQENNIRYTYNTGCYTGNVRNVHLPIRRIFWCDQHMSRVAWRSVAHSKALGGLSPTGALLPGKDRAVDAKWISGATTKIPEG